LTSVGIPALDPSLRHPTDRMRALPAIPGYELLEPLGGGPMTAVYAARSVESDRPCAIKTLRMGWRDEPTAVKLLQREARACLAVAHPRLVRLIDAQVTCPPYFLVLELVSGESLRQRLRRDYRLEMGEAVWVVRQAAEVLAALHRAGFLHGDVKPDNLHLTGTGSVVLLDLGFSHRTGENAAFLRHGYILGTASYLAPELCLAAPSEDFASDVFSLGVTLFEVLTGRLPYPAGSVSQTVRRHRTDPPEDIREYAQGLPTGLAELVGQLLDADPKARPSVASVVHHLIRLEIATLRKRAG
jgi:eukaryotic-like serine/threonine-protein kinase